MGGLCSRLCHREVVRSSRNNLQPALQKASACCDTTCTSAARQPPLQVEGYERSRMALAKSFFENKVRSDAAKVRGRCMAHGRRAGDWLTARALGLAFVSGCPLNAPPAPRCTALCLQMIQRHWREHRLRRLRQQQTEGYQVRVGGLAVQRQGWGLLLAAAA